MLATDSNIKGIIETDLTRRNHFLKNASAQDISGLLGGVGTLLGKNVQQTTLPMPQQPIVWPYPQPTQPVQPTPRPNNTWLYVVLGGVFLVVVALIIKK